MARLDKRRLLERVDRAFSEREIGLTYREFSAIVSVLNVVCMSSVVVFLMGYYFTGIVMFVASTQIGANLYDKIFAKDRHYRYNLRRCIRDYQDCFDS